MRSRLLRILVGLLAFFAPSYVALYALTRDGSADESGGIRAVLWGLGLVSVIVAGLVPSLLFVRSGLPPNTRIGLAIVAGALLVGECLSILYIIVMRGTTG